jgi:PKD repeat protein
MFTNGQAARMINTINSSINNRNNISSPSNLLLTGVTGTNTCGTLADFYYTKANNCAGNTFTFTSLSQFGNSAGTLQWSFPGGTPSTSTNSVEIVSYSTPGSYSVSLTASGSNGTDIETKNSYINIFNGLGGLTVPFSYDFEGSGLPTNLTVINDELDTVLWKHNPTLGANGTNKCIYINNFPDSTNYGNRDYFETPYFDFTGTTGLNFSYYYAYAKRYATQADSFKLQYSLDCGGSWNNVAGIPNLNAMATNSGGTLTTTFVPNASQWKLVNLPSGLLTILNNKPSVKFRFFFKSDYYVNGSNNVYVDQINITGNITTGISDFENMIGFKMYPNPSSNDVLFEMKAISDKNLKLSVIDVMGRCLIIKTFKLSEGTELYFKLNSEINLSAGIYFVNVSVDNKQFTKKLIIEN